MAMSGGLAFPLGHNTEDHMAGDRAQGDPGEKCGTDGNEDSHDISSAKKAQTGLERAENYSP